MGCVDLVGLRAWEKILVCVSSIFQYPMVPKVSISCMRFGFLGLNGVVDFLSRLEIDVWDLWFGSLVLFLGFG